MSPRDRFLEAAVEPLADHAELQLAARHHLEAELSPEAGEAELDAAASRLERGGNMRWRRAWAAVVLAASIPMLVGPVMKLARSWIAIRPLTSYGLHEPGFPFRDTLSPADRLLLFGDDTRPDGTDRWQPLWESDPENPMFYLVYALAYENEHDALPPDFLETGRRIDPDNGWFFIRQAASGAEAVVERDSQSWKDRKAGKPPTWTVKDEGGLAERIDLLKQGAGAPQIRSYRNELAHLRFSKLPVPDDFAESLPPIAYLAGTTIDMSERHVADLVAAEARRCLRERDREAFIELAEVWNRLMPSRLAEAGTLVECLIVNAMMGATLPPMSKAAEALGVDAELWRSRSEEWQARKDALRERGDAADRSASEDRILHHGSALTVLTAPMISRQVMDPPPLTASDLLPATRVEQALIARAMSVATWLLLGCFVLVSLVVGATQAPLARCSVKSFSRIFDRADVGWIGGAGVLAPLLIYLVLRYGTPLSRLEWGPKLTLYAVPVAHFVGLALMWIVWPLAIAGWRAQGLGKLLGWKPPGWWTASAMLAPLAGMVCFSFAVPPGPRSMLLAGIGVFFGAWSLAWWLCRTLASSFGGTAGRVPRQTVDRAARPAWLGAMLLLVGLVFHFHAEERRWFAREEVMRFDPGFTAYEAKVSERLKQELGELLE